MMMEPTMQLVGYMFSQESLLYKKKRQKHKREWVKFKGDFSDCFFMSELASLPTIYTVLFENPSYINLI